MKGLPSCKVHEIVGDRVCNYYNADIDKVVDEGTKHDASRRIVKRLAESVEYVSSRYGEKGLEHFILHHYLDRLSDISVMEALRSFELYVGGHVDLCGATSKVRERAKGLLNVDPRGVH